MKDGRIPIEFIDDNPFGMRTLTDQKKEESLKYSIQDSGLLSRILVRPNPSFPGRFQLVNGRRRLLACKALGWKDIPADIRVMSDAELVRATIAENMQREDLNPIDEAQGFRLLSDFGHTELQVAKIVGRSRPYVANRLRLLTLDPYLVKCVLAKTLAPWQTLLIETIPLGYEKYLLADLVSDWSLTFEELRAAVKTIQAGGSDIRFTRELPVKYLIPAARHLDADTMELEESMRNVTQPFPISVWPDGVVRLGDAMVMAAKRLGWEKMPAEIVFETAWLRTDAASKAELCGRSQYPDSGIFPERTEAQRRNSRRLLELLRGQEERYPILVIEPPLVEVDIEDLPLALPAVESAQRDGKAGGGKIGKATLIGVFNLDGSPVKR